MREEPTEISWHAAEVYRVFRDNPERWLMNKEIAEKTQGVAARTVRAKTSTLVRLGVVEQIEVFPGHRYRLVNTPNDTAQAYRRRLEAALKVFEASGFRPEQERASLQV